MATINLGRVGLVQQGTWQSGVTYQMLDVVRYGSGIYACKASDTTALPTDTTKWEPWVRDGADSTVAFRTFNFFGPLVPTVGITRMYPPTDITITALYASVGVVSGSPISVALKKNNSIVGVVPISAASNRSITQTVSIAVSTSDYLTVDLTTAGGENLSLTLVYT